MSTVDAVAVVKRGYDLFQKGDVENLLGLFADDIEWVSPQVEGVPFGGAIKGKAQVAEFFRKLGGYEEPLAFEPGEFIAEGERVAVVGHYRARVKATGRVVEYDWVHIMTVKGGKLVRFLEVFDSAAYRKALAA